MKKLFLTLLLFNFYTTAFAEAGSVVYEPGTDMPWYQIELIVFETIEPQQTNEKWRVVLEEPAAIETIQLSAAPKKKSTYATAFQTLTPSELELTPHIKSLQHNNANNVLLHTGWRQPLEENTAGVPVHIYSEQARTTVDNTSEKIAENRETVLNNLPGEDGVNTPVENIALNQPGNFVDGTVTLILTRR